MRKMTEITCARCGKKVLRFGNAKYCVDCALGCRGCTPEQSVCKHCGKVFTPNGAHKKFCSYECRKGHRLAAHCKSTLTLTCAYCGKEFTTTDPRRKTCSTECSRAYHTAYNTRYITERRRQMHPVRTVTCAQCGKVFTTARLGKNFCSVECGRKHWSESRRKPKMAVTLACARCGKEFTTDDPRRRYCSKECAALTAYENIHKYRERKRR